MFFFIVVFTEWRRIPTGVARGGPAGTYLVDDCGPLLGAIGDRVASADDVRDLIFACLVGSDHKRALTVHCVCTLFHLRLELFDNINWKAL